MGTVKIVNFQRVLKLGPLFKERLFFQNKSLGRMGAARQAMGDPLVLNDIHSCAV